MIQDSVMDECLNRLQAHFGKKLVIRPPAPTAELARLEEAAGTLPRDIKVFLVTCNGLRVDVDALSENCHIWHIQEMFGALGGGMDTGCRRGFLPVRGALDGECDFVVTDSGRMFGRVVRREAFVPGATLLATTFARYIDGWTRFLIDSFDASGRTAQTHCPPFDPKYIAEIDAELDAARSDPEVESWLTRLNLSDGSGTDFE